VPLCLEAVALRRREQQLAGRRTGERRVDDQRVDVARQAHDTVHLGLDVVVQRVPLQPRREHAPASRDVPAQHAIDEGAHVDPAAPQCASTGGDALEQWGEHRSEIVDKADIGRLGAAVAEDERGPLRHGSPQPHVARPEARTGAVEVVHRSRAPYFGRSPASTPGCW
jgi:hypothetical protein